MPRPAGRLSLTLGQHLRRDRGERSAEEVADIVGVTAGQLRRYERDEVRPPDDVLVPLALVYGDRLLLERHSVARALRHWPLVA